MKKWVTVLCLGVLLSMRVAADRLSPSPFEEAARRAERASEALVRCRRLLEAWWRQRDPVTNLLPQNLQSPLWTPENSAADLYPFLVITAHFIAPEFVEPLLITFRNEVRYTTRVGNLPDAFSLSGHRFAREKVELEPLLFGASEYAKDGLLPMTEVMGRGVWFERMRAIVEEIFARAPVPTAYGNLPADDTEVNGELLQVLCRLFHATGDKRYLTFAERIGDAYCFEVLPASGGLPAHRFDFANHRPLIDKFSLNDHGNEIIGGLAELFFALKVAKPEKAASYRSSLQKMFDLLLEKARNPDGLWVSLLQPSTLQVLEEATPDTWGYALSAVYTFGLATGERKYFEAAEKALRHLNRERYTQWGGADAFADSIEGALLLLNRMPLEEGFQWLEKVAPLFLAKQRRDGIVEGWHGDGNYARTALMLALYDTQGTYLREWRQDVRLGAVQKEGSLYVVLRASKDWQGRLCFDYPRHRLTMGLPLNYPRLNEFPEWFTVEPALLYQVVVEDGEPELRLGEELRRGLPITLKAGRTLRLRIAFYRPPPYGLEEMVQRRMRFTAQTLREARRWQKQARAKLFELMMGGKKPRRVPLNPRVLKQEEVAGASYVLQELTLTSLPDRQLHAWLAIPKRVPRGGVPAVLALHGHGGTGEQVVKGEGLYWYGKVLAEHGWVVIAPDIGSHELQHPGWTLMGERTWDALTCVEYLLSRPEVDKRRIGTIGLSLGGETVMYVAALDERVQVALSSGWLTTISNMKQGHCPCWDFPGLEDYFEFSDIFACVAPRTLILQIGRQERAPGGFPVESAQEAFAELTKVYERFRASDELLLHLHDGGHILPREGAGMAMFLARLRAAK